MKEAVCCGAEYKSVLGDNFAEFKYVNLIDGNKEYFTFYTQNKKDASYKKVMASDNKWGETVNDIAANTFVDGNENTAYDFVGGKKGEESYNFIITFDGEELFDKIVFSSANWEAVFPTRLNFYVGDSLAEVFGADAKPLKEYFKAAENGEYIAQTTPVKAEIIRIEVVDNRCDYYDGLIMSVVKDISVYGVADAPSTVFGQRPVKALNRLRTKPVSVMQPYLFKGADGKWTNSEWRPSSEYTEDDIDIAYLGDGFTEVDCGGACLLNIGSTDDPAHISNHNPLPLLENIDELYFFVKLTSKGKASSGKLKLQLVSGKHTVSNLSFDLEPDKWTKIDLRALVTAETFEGYRGAVEGNKLRRIVINCSDGKMNTKLCVGSVLACSKIDWSQYGIDLNELKHCTKAQWQELLKTKNMDPTAIIGKKFDL